MTLKGRTIKARTLRRTAKIAEIAEHGYRVIRFWNNEVLDNLDGNR